LWLGFELLAPVLECLLWKAMNLAILPLVQVATLPRLMMRTPERLTLTLPCSMFVRHLALSHLQIEGREQIVFGSCEVSVRGSHAI